MKLLDKKELFYRSLDDLPHLTDDLDKKRKEIKKIVLSFNKSLQKITPDKKLVKKNKELGETLTATINQIKAGGNSWVNNYQAMEEREKFRSDLASYFIIIIFGKVKAGKSSLGNFIAKQKLPTQEVSFFKYDEAGKEVTVKELEEVDDDSFATNNLECTAEIQGFKLGRLAWIDTPGLGSMTKENGDLAKEYIQAADYIIYPTSSDSPLQKDETNQLEELFTQNKKVTICITKSDETEEDECVCGSENGCENCNSGIVNTLLNKNSNNRQKQESWVKEEIIKIIPSDKKAALLGDVFSISVHTAKQGLAQSNDKLYENSHLSIFYDQVTDVLKHKAADLKTSTPYDSLKAFINKDILGLEGTGTNSIKIIKDSLDDLDKQISESLQRFTDLQNNTENDVKSILDEVLTKYSIEINQSNLNDILTQVDKEVGEQVSKELQNNITEIFSDFETSLDQFTKSFDSKEFKINDKYKEVSYTTTTVRKKMGSGIGSLLGAAGGFIVAGPAGLVLGGMAGKAAGGAIGAATSSTKKIKVKTGDNKEEVLQKFKSYKEEGYTLQVNTVYQQLQNDFFEPLQRVSEIIAEDINRFEKDLARFKEKLC